MNDDWFVRWMRAEIKSIRRKWVLFRWGLADWVWTRNWPLEVKAMFMSCRYLGMKMAHEEIRAESEGPWPVLERIEGLYWERELEQVDDDRA